VFSLSDLCVTFIFVEMVFIYLCILISVEALLDF
jgi:hypothetical protein